MQQYRKLKAYGKVHKHCNVPQSQSYKGQQLARWVNFQRTLKRNGKLLNYREKLLNDLGFSWSIQKETHDALWMETYDQLVEFKAKNRHFRVQNAKDKALLDWMNKQRRRNLSGKLRDDQKEMLDEINFVWDARKLSSGDAEDAFSSDSASPDDESDDEEKKPRAKRGAKRVGRQSNSAKGVAAKAKANDSSVDDESDNEGMEDDKEKEPKVEHRSKRVVHQSNGVKGAAAKVKESSVDYESDNEEMDDNNVPPVVRDETEKDKKHYFTSELKDHTEGNVQLPAARCDAPVHDPVQTVTDDARDDNSNADDEAAMFASDSNDDVVLDAENAVAHIPAASVEINLQ